MFLGLCSFSTLEVKSEGEFCYLNSVGIGDSFEHTLCWAATLEGLVKAYGLDIVSKDISARVVRLKLKQNRRQTL